MSQKHFLLKGTFILTVVGILTRVMGFFTVFFSADLSLQKKSVCIQLIFPVYTLAYAATSAGIETALARLVAASSAKKAVCKSLFLPESSTALFSFLSICCLFLLQKNAVFLTTVILGDPRCASLIFLIAYALPFAALHSCSCGYFLGLKQIRLPALSQLFEQLVRIFLLSSSIQPMFIPLLHHLSQLLSSELSVVKLQPLFFASISSELPGNLSPHTGSRLFLLFLPCFFCPSTDRKQSPSESFSESGSNFYSSCPAKVWNEYLRFS